MAFIYNLTDTWNSGATTFAGIKMAVTNTASGASSKLLDLTVTGSTSATFVVTRTGNVGVGTSTPNETAGYNWLTIDGPSTGGIISLSAATVELFRTQAIAANSVTLATQTAIPLLFSTASTERMRIASSGNVGIGTSNPLARLDIAGGGAQIRAGSDTGANLALWQNTSGGFEGNLGSFALAFFTGANNSRTEKMRIGSDGVVSIGTTTTALYDNNTGGDVSQYWRFQASYTNGVAKLAGGSISPTYAFMGFSGVNSASKSILIGGVSGTLSVTTAGSEEGFLQFWTKPSGANAFSSERMRITATGDVGIGTGSPSSKLDVNGTITATNGGVAITNAAYAGLQVTSGTVQAQFAANNGGSVDVRAVSNHPMAFYTNNLERMRVDATGLAVGITSPSARVDVSGSAANSASSLGASDASTLRINNSAVTALNEKSKVVLSIGNVASAAVASYYATYNGVGDLGVGLIFGTQQNLAGGTVERMRITSVGNIHTPAGATNMNNGFFYMPAAAGAPTGTPTSISGTVPFYYDATNNNFYVYNGTWKKVALT